MNRKIFTKYIPKADFIFTEVVKDLKKIRSTEPINFSNAAAHPEFISMRTISLLFSTPKDEKFLLTEVSQDTNQMSADDTLYHPKLITPYLLTGKDTTLMTTCPKISTL